MKVYGASVIKGLLYTLKVFVGTYVEDFKRKGSTETEHGMRSQTEGIVTVQYPEEEMAIGATYERFRVLPMLLYDQKEDEKEIRCTSCGICAKVCPPQCIWIVQDSDEKGKPIPKPAEFYIDASVCMNCGLCAEFCPFDAIKMDHQFTLNVTENRQENYLYDLDKLLVPTEYYAELHPKDHAQEEILRKAEAEAKAKKEEEKKARLAKKAAEKAEPSSGDSEAAEKPKAAKAEDPERAARVAAAKEKAAIILAKKAAEKAAAAGDSSATPIEESAVAKPAAKAEDPERAARIAAAKEKAAAVKAQKAAEKAAATTEISEAEAEQAVPPHDQIAPVPPASQELPDTAESAQAQAEANPVFPDGVEEISTANEVGQSHPPETAATESEASESLAQHRAEIAKAADAAKAEAQANPVIQNPSDSNEAGQSDSDAETPKASPEA